MFSRLRKFLKKDFIRVVRSSPLVCDLAIATALIPAFTYIAYSAASKPASTYDWHLDRLMKRDAYIASGVSPMNTIELLRSQYSKDSHYLVTYPQPTIKLKKLYKCFFRLNAANNKLIIDEKMRKEAIDEGFMDNIIGVLGIRSKIVAAKSKQLLYEFCVFEESALNLLLVLSLSSDPIYEKYKPKIDAVMNSIRKENNPYTLKNALAESYFFNMKKSSTGIIYDGRVVTMNPERMENFDTDILFIHGQQSHCFTSWRISEPENLPVRLYSKRTYIISTLWPPKFLSDKYASRLLTLNYLVLCLKFIIDYTKSNG